MTTTRTIRWGIISTGGIVPKVLADLRRVEGSEVIAVSSRTQARADEFAAAHGIPAGFGDLDAMLALPELDAVYIASPHPMHAAGARAAILAGKHVLCEKPMTMTADDARELQALAAEHGVFLMEAMWSVFNPTILRMQELISSGAIGEPMLVQSGMGFAPPPTFERFWRADLGGGPLFDMGVYTVTLAHLVLGAPDAITARGRMRADGVDLTEAVIFEYASGAYAQLTMSMEFSVPGVATIGGTTGWITIAHPFHAATSLTMPTGTYPAIVPKTIETPMEGNGYTPMVRAAVESIREGLLEHPARPLSETIAVIESLERVRDLLAAQRG